MNFSELKIKAKQINGESKPSVYTCAVIFVGITALLSFLAERISGITVSQTTMDNLQQAANNGNYEYVLSFFEKAQPSKVAYLISFILDLVSWIVSAGFIIFMMNTIRKNAPVYQNLLDGFPLAGKLILLFLLESIFIALWSLLLFIPGIIAIYRYRMAVYILLDHPEYSAMECIRKSKKMMKGHKWELFTLDFSFLGWLILAGIFFPLRIYTEPYLQGTYILYYQNLAGFVPTDNILVKDVVEP